MPAVELSFKNRRYFVEFAVYLFSIGCIRYRKIAIDKKSFTFDVKRILLEKIVN